MIVAEVVFVVVLVFDASLEQVGFLTLTIERVDDARGNWEISNVRGLCVELAPEFPKHVVSIFLRKKGLFKGVLARKLRENEAVVLLGAFIQVTSGTLVPGNR